MTNGRDRILLVENDPVVADLIGRQALQGIGHQVVMVGDANTAISRAIQWVPDLILVDINLPGLSGKDLLVALKSQGLQTPVVLLAQRGQESDIVQAFRLGAADYLLLPVREAEVISAVERVLKQVHERQELQLRVRELTTVFAVGKAVTSITDMSLLMNRILEGAVRVTQADLGWFLMREESDQPFVLVADNNLPPSLGLRLGQPWDDGISKLVAMSGETLTIHGEPLKRFKIYTLGQSALIVPIRAQKKNQRTVIGLLAMIRRQPAAFGPSEQHLLEALADYASISLVNANLFRSSEERARSLQSMAESALTGGQINNEILLTVKNQLNMPVETAAAALGKLGKDPTARWRPDQRQMLASIQDQLDTMRQIASAILPTPMPPAGSKTTPTNLNDLIRQAVQRAQPLIQQAGLSVSTELAPESMLVAIDPGVVGQLLDGVMSQTVHFSVTGGQIVIRMEKAPDSQVHTSIRSVGVVLNPKEAEHIFDESYRPASGVGRRFGGLGIRLHLVKDILTRHNGKIWLESQPGKGTTFHFNLPLAR
jgi:signal transduction histidine kinase